MSLTYGTVLTEGYNWPQHSVGLVNVSPIQSDPIQHPKGQSIETSYCQHRPVSSSSICPARASIVHPYRRLESPMHPTQLITDINLQ